MSEEALRGYLEIAVGAARRAGALVCSRWGDLRAVEEKRDADLVTDVDLASERLIREALTARSPEVGILGEEGGGEGLSQEGLVWCVDPVDGTTNLAHGFDRVAVSIALMLGGRPQVGVVYNPLREELFYARRGGGAWLNDARLRVSGVETLSGAMLATGFPTTRRTTRVGDNIEDFVAFARLAQGMRRTGSAALDLAGVAGGWFDGFWEPGLRAWDVAAAWLLVEEAGGEVTRYNGGAFDAEGGECLASNGRIHAGMVEVLTRGGRGE